MGTHTRTETRARTHARTQMNTNAQMSSSTQAHAQRAHTHILAQARAPKNPVEDPAHPRYPLVPPSTPAVRPSTPRYPLVPLRYPLSTPTVARVPLGNAVRTPPIPRRHRVGSASAPRRYRVGTASVPRACSAEYPLSASQLSLETRVDRAVLNRARQKCPLEYFSAPHVLPSSTP